MGDTAGMGADLFESYAATTIAGMLIGYSVFKGHGAGEYLFIIIGVVGLIASIISSFFVRTGEKANAQMALNKGLWGTNILTAVGCFAVVHLVLPDTYDAGNVLITPNKVFLCVLCGLAVNILIGLITEYYTSNAKNPRKPSRKLL